VISLHLAHISEQERLRQLAFLLARHRETPFDGGVRCGDEPEDWSNNETEPENPLSAVWMGDFNNMPDSHAMLGSSPYGTEARHVDGFHDSTVLGGHQTDAFISYEGPDPDGTHPATGWITVSLQATSPPR